MSTNEAEGQWKPPRRYIEQDDVILVQEWQPMKVPVYPGVDSEANYEWITVDKLRPSKAGTVLTTIHTGRGGLVSETQSQVPLTHPMRAAWENYKTTDNYANSRRWATHPDAAERKYVDGSLWAAFVAGWESALLQPGVPIPQPEDGSAATSEEG